VNIHPANQTFEIPLQVAEEPTSAQACFVEPQTLAGTRVDKGQMPKRQEGCSELQRILERRRKQIDNETVMYTRDGVGKQVNVSPREITNIAHVATPGRNRGRRSVASVKSPTEDGTPQALTKGPIFNAFGNAHPDYDTESAPAKIDTASPSANVMSASAVCKGEFSEQVCVSRANRANGNVHQLLTLVQSTCEQLADRLKKCPRDTGTPGRVSLGDSPATPTAAAIAAARATRDLLGEVELVYLSDSRSQAPSVPDDARTQWFTVSTPTEGGRRMSHTKRRRSWPCIRRSGESSFLESPIRPDHLGEWVEEVRRIDPCPFLSPPQVLAPQSPHLHCCDIQR